ncbi:MAG: hypothetical protein R3A10_15625 [Caldilineaceae bacterium]
MVHGRHIPAPGYCRRPAPLWRIDTLPPGFHFDESFEGMEAWRILTDPGYRPVFLTGNFGVPPLSCLRIARSCSGCSNCSAARQAPRPCAPRRRSSACWACAERLCRSASYARWTTGPTVCRPRSPLLAAGVLAVMRWHVHFSRMGIEPVIVPLVWAAARWLFLRGWRTGFPICSTTPAAASSGRKHVRIEARG